MLCGDVKLIYGASQTKKTGAFFLAEIFEKVSLDPYNFWISRLSARKSEPMKNF